MNAAVYAPKSPGMKSIGFSLGVKKTERQRTDQAAAWERERRGHRVGGTDGTRGKAAGHRNTLTGRERTAGRLSACDWLSQREGLGRLTGKRIRTNPRRRDGRMKGRQTNREPMALMCDPPVISPLSTLNPVHTTGRGGSGTPTASRTLPSMPTPPFH